MKKVFVFKKDLPKAEMEHEIALFVEEFCDENNAIDYDSGFGRKDGDSIPLMSRELAVIVEVSVQ